MTLKEEKQLQTQLRQHIIRTINPDNKAFRGVRVESGRTIFTDGAILCVYDYILPEAHADGWYKIAKKGELVFDSAVSPGVGVLQMWGTVIPEESVYTEEVDFSRTANPEFSVSRLLAHLGSKGVILNLRYFLDLPRGLYTILYRPHEEDGKRVPVTLRRRICDEVEFKAVLMPLAPLPPICDNK